VRYQSVMAGSHAVRKSVEELARRYGFDTTTKIFEWREPFSLERYLKS